MTLPVEHPKLDTLQAGLAYLMTRYSNIVSLRLQLCPACCAVAIVDHLEALLRHPEVQSSSVLSATYSGLVEDWEVLTEHQESNHPAVKKQLAEAQQNGSIH